MAEKEPSTSLTQDPLFETVGSTQKIDSPTSVYASPWSKLKRYVFWSTPMRIVFGAGIGFCIAFCVALYLSAQSQPGAVQNLKTWIDIGQELVSVGQEMTEDGPPLAGEEIPRGLALKQPTLSKATSAAGTDIAVSKSGNVTVTNMDDFFAKRQRGNWSTRESVANELQTWDFFPKKQRGNWSPPSVAEFRTGVISRESLPPFPTRIGPKQISAILSEVISEEQGILNLEKSGAAKLMSSKVISVEQGVLNLEKSGAAKLMSSKVIFVEQGILNLKKSGAAKSRLGQVIMFLGFLYILGDWAAQCDWAGLSLPVSLSTGGGFLVFSLICSCVGGFIGASFSPVPSD